MDYGKGLRIARAISGLQQKELASLADVDASLVSLIEMGRRNPSLSTLKRLSKALQIPEHLLTLLSAEPDDLDLDNQEELQRVAQSLAQLLFRHAAHARFRRKLPLFSGKT